MIWLSVKRDLRIWSLLSAQIIKLHLSPRLFFGGTTELNRLLLYPTISLSSYSFYFTIHSAVPAVSQKKLKNLTHL